MKNSFLTLADFSKDELMEIINIAIMLKEMRRKKVFKKYLENVKGAFIFEKPSTRTRISFETGLVEMGAYPMILSKNDLQLSRGESIKDTAKIISLFTDLLVIRTSSHKNVEEFAKYADIPVINALTDKYHPCQVLADMLTIYEIFNTFEGLKIAYIGDGNNIANSLAIACAIFGLSFSIATPKGYEVSRDIVKKAKAISKDFKLFETNKPAEAVIDADIVYTDVWISMGDEDKREKRMLDFKRFTVNKELMEKTGKNSYFMHCLPAHIGLEVERDVLYSDRSLIYRQSENRLHIQKALVLKLLQINVGGEDDG
ncbi:MAG: ornithine carbamoyltransferase [Deferribacterota bacterium]|nr:ornithine carbamoyltransferase [Deferribacterota bacterium]